MRNRSLPSIWTMNKRRENEINPVHATLSFLSVCGGSILRALVCGHFADGFTLGEG